MKPKLYLHAFWSVVFILSITAYAMGCSKDRPKDSGKTGPEDRQLATVREESHHHLEEAAERNPDEILLADDNESSISTSGSVAFENALSAWETASPKNLKVSSWLEMRAIKEAATREPTSGRLRNSQTPLHPDEEEEILGGGWCNNCGCWLRHGCDTNQNCGLKHEYNCNSGLSCSLHSGNCISTG